MDTRSKIYDAAAFAVRPGTYVVAYLDPLTAAHARRLEQVAGAGGSVVVLLADPPDALLPARARAELAASLACVAAVVVGGDRLLAELPPGTRVVHEEAADLERRAALMAQVHARHAAV